MATLKCEICGNKVEELYLKKIKGTFIKDEKGKKHTICSDCQNKLENDKKKMLTEI